MLADEKTVVPPAESASGKPSTRDRLVESARQLFLAQGYERTSIADVLRDSGVNSGSLYYFFKTKETLLVAVLDRYVELLRPVVLGAVFERVSDPIDRVFGVLDGYREMLMATDCRQGCPIGNLALEMSERSDAVREKLVLNFDHWRAAIRQCLSDAGERLPANVDRDKLATFALSIMEGGVMLARTHRSVGPFDDAVDSFRDYIDRLMYQANSNSLQEGETS